MLLLGLINPDGGSICYNSEFSARILANIDNFFPCMLADKTPKGTDHKDIKNFTEIIIS